MRNNKEYITPEIDAYEVIVEQGFINSMEDPDLNDEIEW